MSSTPSPAAVDVVVLGAGPAGAAAAIGLRRLGHSVAILGRPRPAVTEGLGARSIERLRAAGLPLAAAAAGDTGPRIGIWAGVRSPRGGESLVDRTLFDRALAQDLADAGVSIVHQTARLVKQNEAGWWIAAEGTAFSCRALIDARGRRAHGVERNGPRLIAWSERWRGGAPAAVGSAVVALADGWCWLAKDANGGLQRQFVCAARPRPTVAQLRERFEAAAAVIPELDFSPRGATPAPLRATAAAMRCACAAPACGYVRIGDAALALDPLSGHGIYEALGSARVGVAALHSYLGGTDWTTITRFTIERTAEVWRRAVTTAGEFYRLQADRAPSTSFWRSTAAEYERLAAEADAAVADRRPGRIESRPVLNGTRIEVRPVWVSARWPRGVWRGADGSIK